MADVHEPQIRSYNMSQIRSKNTKPEILVRKLLHANGFRFRIHDKKLPGKPDIVLPKYKTIIFIHGCFWHGHEGCKYYVIPKTRTEWWISKINRNKEVDYKNTQNLRQHGWKVLTVFECNLKKGLIDKTLKKLINKLHAVK